MSKRQAKPIEKRRFQFKINRHGNLPEVILSWLFVIFITAVSIFAGYGAYSFYKANYKKNDVVKTKPEPKRKAVQPLKEGEYVKPKTYAFYTQLEDRVFSIDGEEKSGGEALDIILSRLQEESQTEDLPQIVLESLQDNEILTHNEESIANSIDLDSVKAAVESQTIMLQTGSFVSQQEAINHRNILENYGLQPKIFEAKNRHNELIYRVQIGPFNKAESAKVKEKLNSYNISFFAVY